MLIRRPAATKSRVSSRVFRRGEADPPYETVRSARNGRSSTFRSASPRCATAPADRRRSKIARDVSERSRRAEAEGQRATPGNIDCRHSRRESHTTDSEGKITYFNEAAVALAGRTLIWAPMNGASPGSSIVRRHTPCPMTNVDAVALKEGRAIRNAEAVAERPDGSASLFIPFPTPLRDGTGKCRSPINMLLISATRQAERSSDCCSTKLNHRARTTCKSCNRCVFTSAKRGEEREARQVPMTPHGASPRWLPPSGALWHDGCEPFCGQRIPPCRL